MSPPDDADEHRAPFPVSDKRELMADETNQLPETESNQPLTRLPFKAVLLLVGVTLVWGAVYPVMKIAAAEIPILTFRGLIAIGAGIVMLTAARLAGHPLRIPRENRKGLFISSLYNTFGGHVLATISTQLISAGQTALIMYTMPIWTFLIGIFVLGERPSRTLWLGLALGIMGIGLIATQNTSASWLSPGILIALVGAISWAAGTVTTKSVNWMMPMSVMTGWQFMIGGVPLCFLAVFELDELSPVSIEAICAAVFVMVLPLLFGYWAFFRIIEMVPASVASLSIVAVPGVSLLLGPLLVDEPITIIDFFAFALIGGALLTVLPLPRLRQSGSPRRVN